jgi:hypothetical protein
MSPGHFFYKEHTLISSNRLLRPFEGYPSFSFYKVRTQIKIQTLLCLTNTLRIDFLFFSVNLIWLDLSSNILSNNYMFITIKNII